MKLGISKIEAESVTGLSFGAFLGSQLQGLRQGALIIAALMYALFGVMDYIRYPLEVYQYTVPLRVIFVILPLVFAINLSWGKAPKNIRVYIGLMLLVFLSAGVLHSVIFVMADYQDIEFSQMGLVLILMFGCLFTGLPVVAAGAVTAAILVIHFAASLTVNKTINGPVFDSTILLLVAVLCLLVNQTCQNILRSNFRLLRQLYNDSINDSLTGVFNRRYLMGQAERGVKQASRDGCAVALVMVDVDHFKVFNDQQGHLLGDALLQKFARMLGTYCRRPSDFLARFGGDEFTLFLYGVKRERVEEICAEIVASAIALGEPHPGTTSRLATLSVGAIYADVPISSKLDKLLSSADHALLSAKKNGCNGYVVETEIVGS
ncbi:MAG: GGDEF domain-containing protein [Gammaproteobacteria bacterium]|nr:GGDEF domain-containing protein [Gammaproteobacteria bacterium]MBQ0773424.1 GGDEF domain-containing protein [Gammaproteobacteria bacterium]